MNKSEAVAMLIRVFNDNKLSFRDMDLLKSVFDEAVEATNEERASCIAEKQMQGFKIPPCLPDKDIEDDYYLSVESSIEEAMERRGVRISDKGKEALVDFLTEKKKPEDFYYEFDID